MSDPYPRSFVSIQDWSKANGLPLQDARVRFAQFAILCGIASDEWLRSSLVFKGGNALDFILQPNRSTIDPDFSLDVNRPSTPFELSLLRDALGRGLSAVAPRHGMRLAVQGVRQKPPGDQRTFATIEARIGYALPDELQLIVRLEHGQPSSNVIPVEVSLNESIYATEPIVVDQGVPSIRMATLEDIVGEKLRALLQQPIRNRSRSQDLLDIAVILQFGHHMDPARVAEALMEKAAARNVPVSRIAFRQPDIANRARVNYDVLRATTRVRFVPFDEALTTVLAFIDTLPIPEIHEAV